MRISKISIRNFRNFVDFEVSLGDNAVILGENRVGESNLLHALRLIFDPTLPDSSRRLRLEDFPDGLARPLRADEKVSISVELQGFEDDSGLLSILGDSLIQAEPMVARLTYRFQPRTGLTRPPRSEADYEFSVFGGEEKANAHHVGYQARRWMPMDLFHALRDAEGDLSRWSRSPLRPLLDRAATGIDEAILKDIVGKVDSATASITDIEQLSDVVAHVNAQLITMVGSQHATDTGLGFAPTDGARLIRALQLMIDGNRRGVAEASLGSANVLYLALKHLEMQALADDKVRHHTFLAIEEPEAHLHPHLQRLIYRTYLQVKGDGESINRARTILLTTHSPNIASVAPLSDIVVLRRVGDRTVGRSLHRVGEGLEKNDRDDLERYLDVTRGELFFSRAVLLVEGDAEKFLIPTLAAMQDPPLDLDALGITVCSISGTNFAPYLKLVGEAGLGIPFAVLTDFDPKMSSDQEDPDFDDDEDPPKNSYGLSRVVNQIMREIMTEDEWDEATFTDIVDAAPANGVFLNDYTFEVDLFKSGMHREFRTCIDELTTNQAMQARFAAWSASPATLDEIRFLKDIDSIGKGRVAQRLSSVLQKSKSKAMPPYIEAAFRSLKRRIG
ncbi:AAA family ATPase [Stenotrophomonas maltophilia]|uniref:ATP-dependent nuclease n=1 Tax=Stenotrophomonas maltophilia TaxID=40324 RepID=UPI0018D3A77C|nr:AAA family ATPase [Stenotrophomonas maltophilia]MBH1816810.1 AAA family ATPase [Stenotrophomonas maltophilia]MCU1029729.1 AAA family ATPase [Stenotrophomonas maltophilia]